MFRSSILAVLVTTCLLLNKVTSVGANDNKDSSPPATRGLQDLYARWNIQEPTFEYDSLEFSLNWKVSDFIEDRFMDYRVYDGFGCKEGSNDITDQSRDSVNGTAYLFTPGIIPSALTPHNPSPTSGSGERSVHLRLSIQPQNIVQSPIYIEDTSQSQVRAEVRFCVRYSLWNDYSLLEDSVEVNFQETLIYFEVDLTDGFDVGAIQVADAEKGLETANIGCEVYAFECYENRTAITNPGFLRNQGDETRICVATTPESKANGLYMNRINWFYFYRINPDGTVRQNAIIYDSIPAPNGLTDYSCQPGEDPCPFDTILFAQFYDRAGVGIVLGEGEATCQYGQSGFDNDIFTLSGDGPTGTTPLSGTAPPGSTPSPAGVQNDQPSDPTTNQEPGSTPAPQVAPTPAPVLPTPAPVAPTNRPTPAPQTPAPTPQPVYVDVGVFPTPEPCTNIICQLYLNCGTEARVLYESDADVAPLPTGAIVIDEQAADGTSVTFTVTQLWKNDDSISWIALMYPDHTEGHNICPHFQAVGYQESFQHTATCFDHAASNVHLYVELYVQDDSLEPNSEAFVLEGCEGPTQSKGRKVGYEIYIPCAPCGRRALSEDTVLSSQRITEGHEVGEDGDDSSQLVSASSSNNIAQEFSKTPKASASGARLAKTLVERQRQRKLQQQEALPPSPFELEFSIQSTGGSAFSSAPAATRSLPIMLMMTMGITFVATFLGTIG